MASQRAQRREVVAQPTTAFPLVCPQRVEERSAVVAQRPTNFVDCIAKPAAAIAQWSAFH